MNHSASGWAVAFLVAVLGVCSAAPTNAQIPYIPADIPLCGLDPSEFGIVPRFTVPAKQQPRGQPDFGLRAKIFRYQPPSEHPQSISADGVQESTVRDFILVFHLPEESVASEIRSIQDNIVLSSGWQLIAVDDCRFSDPENTVFYDPFIREVDKDQIVVSSAVIVLTRSVAVTTVPQPPTKISGLDDDLALFFTELEPLPAPTELASAPAIDAPVEEEKPTKNEPPTWQRNLYPWIVDLDFAAEAAGEEVFVADRVQCEKSGNFIVGSMGSIALPEEAKAASEEEIPVRRQQMIAVNVYFGASGNPLDQDAVEESVDDTAYWCIPKKEFCYQKIEFGDFGVRSRQGEISQFNQSDVVSLRHGFVSALQRVIMDSCPQETMQGK